MGSFPQSIKNALNAFGYILEYNQKYSAKEFADAIRKHCSDVKADYLAKEIEKLKLYVVRDRFQTTIHRAD